MGMKPEQKKALGCLIRQRRKQRNWTQEQLAGAAEINLRTVQRAECGEGISQENLKGIAHAFDVDERELVKEAGESAGPSPEKRLGLRQITSPRALIELLSKSQLNGNSLEISPPGEHECNDLIGEELLYLLDLAENATGKSALRAELVSRAGHLLRAWNKMGLGVFGTRYFEEIPAKTGSWRKSIILVIAAPLSDHRVRKTGKGLQLDMVRDSRQLLYGRLLGRQSSAYDWMEDQLVAKSNGEMNVRDALRKIFRETWDETQRSRSDQKRAEK